MRAATFLASLRISGHCVEMMSFNGYMIGGNYCSISTLIAYAYSTANIKALRGSLGALSVNKLSHIPKLQPISAVYENQ